MSIDHIVDLGDDRFGILSRSGEAADSGVCVILFNAGFIHRSGPFRLHARLSRQLADAGHAAFRFDAPGIGDSIGRSDQPLVQTMRAGMDALERQFGYSRFVVGGCAVADPSGGQRPVRRGRPVVDRWPGRDGRIGWRACVAPSKSPLRRLASLLRRRGRRHGFASAMATCATGPQRASSVPSSPAWSSGVGSSTCSPGAASVATIPRDL
jgi:hypothetical protein